jgi:hypothetical protein
MKITVLVTVALIAGWGCGVGSIVNPPPVHGQNPPPFSGTFAFGNGPLVGAVNASNGNLTGTLTFAGSCPAQVTGTYQEIGQAGQAGQIGQTAFGQMTATPLTTTPGCSPGSPVFNFFVAVSSTKAYFSFSQAGTSNQISAEGFK